MSKYESCDLPDWKNLNAYKWLRDLSPSARAWEGLRRNEAYRRDFHAFASLVDKYGTLWTTSDEAMVHQPERLAGESERQWISRVVADRKKEFGGLQPSQRRLDDFLAEKWGLSALFNPNVPIPKADNVFLLPRLKILMKADEPTDFAIEEFSSEGKVVRVPNGQCYVRLDLTASRRPQISQIEKIFESYQASISDPVKLGRNRDDSFIRQMRALDALRTVPRPTQREIGIVLCPQVESAATRPEDRAKALIKSARKFSSVGYKTLLV